MRNFTTNKRLWFGNLAAKSESKWRKCKWTEKTKKRIDLTPKIGFKWSNYSGRLRKCSPKAWSRRQTARGSCLLDPSKRSNSVHVLSANFSHSTSAIFAQNIWAKQTAIECANPVPTKIDDHWQIGRDWTQWTTTKNKRFVHNNNIDPRSVL